MTPEQTNRLLADARRELADRKVRTVGLSRDWLIIETLFAELDRDRPFLLPAERARKP
jgi:hypothetical protein